ncbi:SH3 domain-containing protein [Ancylobacter sp. VNQ12]|uniref:SH3 domain-containing protein n=1 Tax=Ancylobacter sp. VNQ12 TaxID=3400920 RepID=UPI003C0C1119
MRFTTSFALASGMLVAGSLAAAAWPAVTRSNTNVRGGPGVGYNVLGTLPAGAPVEVVSCAGAWCQTQYGYVSTSLLAQATAGSPLAYRSGAVPGLAAGVGQPTYGAAALGYGGATGTNYRLPYNTSGVVAPSYAAPAVAAPQAHGLEDYNALSAAGGTGAVASAMAGEAGTAHPGENTTMAGSRTTIGTTNVRSGPGTEYNVVKTLPDFTKVEVSGCNNGWCQTNEGYISIYLLSRGPVQQVLTPQAEPRVPGSQTRDSLNYNLANQAAMGYGAAGNYAGTAGLPYSAAGALPYASGGTNYRLATAAAQPTRYGAAYGGAVAGGGTTTAAVNVRSGPGVRYGVLGTLPAGSPVNIVSCSGAWCQTQYGYVSARHVTQGAFAAPAAYRSAAVPGLAAGVGQPAYGAAALGYGGATGTNYRLPYNTSGVVAPSYAAPAVAAPQAHGLEDYNALSAAGGTGAVASAMAGEAGTAHPGENTTMAGSRTTIGTTNVRSGPGTEYDVVKTLPDFTKVEVSGCNNGWCQTNEGYISIYLLSRGPVQQVLTPQAEPRVPGSQTRDSLNYNLANQAAMGYGAAGNYAGTASLPYSAAGALPYASAGTNYRLATAAAQPTRYGAAYGGAVAGGGTTMAAVNVRSGPGVRYGVLGTLPAGSPVTIVSCAGAWCQTQYGYVSARHVTQGAFAAPALPLTGVPLSSAVPVAATVPGIAVTPGIAGAAALGYGATGTNYRQPVNTAGVSTQPVAQIPSTARAYAPVLATAAAPGIAPAGAAVASAAGYSATTTAAVNVRNGPGTGYEVLGTVPAGTPVNIVSCAGAWCQTQYGYVSARHLSTGQGMVAAAGRPASTRVTVRPARVSSGSYSNVAYVDPAYAAYPEAYGTGYAVSDPGYAGYGGYGGVGYAPAPNLGGAVLATLAAPIVGVAAAVDTVVNGWSGGYGGGGWYGSSSYGYGYGAGNVWRASWGPGYWGPGVTGPNRPSYWGARPSYWGGRPTYWNMHPGYTNYPRFGDRYGDTYWSRRGEGRLPQRANYYGYSGLGPRWQGPYDAGPWYNGRPVSWRPRAARW